MGITKKTLLISAITIITLMVIACLSASIFTKYFIEKYDEAYTGRKIAVGNSYVNLLTGYFQLNDLRIYETDSQQSLNKGSAIFISAKKISGRLNLVKLFQKKYEISDVIVDHPIVQIIQRQRYFNFDDLIYLIHKQTTGKKEGEKSQFNVSSLRIIDGICTYQEKLTPINYFIKNVNIASKQDPSNKKNIFTQFSFLSGIGVGEISGDFKTNLITLEYELSVIAKNYNLSIINQYFKDLVKKGDVSGFLDANFKSIGTFKDRMAVTNSGIIEIRDIHLGQTLQNTDATLKKLTIAIKQISPNKKIFLYDSIVLLNPYIKYIHYPHYDNIQRLFEKNTTHLNISKSDRFNLITEIADYLKTLSKILFSSNYKVSHLAVYNGELKIMDVLPQKNFSIDLHALNLSADSVERDKKRILVLGKTKISHQGLAQIHLKINPKDERDFELKYDVKNISLQLFNPYVTLEAPFAFDNGTANGNGLWAVNNDNIKSDNYLTLENAKISKTKKPSSGKHLPMALLLNATKNSNNVITCEFPISGTLKDPKLNLRKLFLDALKNSFKNRKQSKNKQQTSK